MALADARMPNDDASYTGEVSDSVFSLDYYRNKAREYQVAMNALDDSWHAANSALVLGVDEDTAAYIVQWLEAFDAKRAQARMIGEGINLAANVINSAGGRFPVLSIPGSLGALPFVMPAAAIAAFAAASTFVVWGAQMVSGLNERLRLAQLLDAQSSPEQRAQLAAEVARVDAAQRELNLSPLGSLAPLLKWGALAVGAFVAWKLLAPRLRAR